MFYYIIINYYIKLFVIHYCTFHEFVPRPIRAGLCLRCGHVITSSSSLLLRLSVGPGPDPPLHPSGLQRPLQL